MNEHTRVHLKNLIVRTNDILSNNIDSETILLHIKNSKYYGMDTIGSRIWQLLEHPIEVNTLIQTLVEEYEVTFENCEQDVLLFLSQLLEEKLLQILDA